MVWRKFMLENLTKREIQVLKLVTDGYSNSQISKELHITVHTAKAHVQSILYKFRVKNRVQAAVLATRLLIKKPEN